LASTQMRGEHIRVMVLLDRLSPERRAWFELLTLAIGFSLMFVIAWHCLPYAIDSYASNERGLGSGSIPVYPGKFSFFAGCTLFGIQFFIQFLSRLFAKLAGEIPASKEKS
jgi:TRAP-type mannitol/chloroaromatic compound transport system permease small subunit